VEGSVKLNQVITMIAKQMCRAELAKAFSHWLLEVEIAICKRTGSLADLRLRQKNAAKAFSLRFAFNVIRLHLKQLCLNILGTF